MAQRILMRKKEGEEPSREDIATLKAHAGFKVIDVSDGIALVEGDKKKIDEFAKKNGWVSYPKVEGYVVAHDVP